MYQILGSKQIWRFVWFFIMLSGCNGVSGNNPGNGSSVGISPSGYDAQNVLLLSDIHFNPYAECSKNILPCPSLKNLIENSGEQWSNYLNSTSINTYSEETNNAFLIRGFDNLALIAAEKKVKTIFITGDLLAHNFDGLYKTFAPAEYKEQLTEFSSKTLLYVLQELHKRLPVDSKIYLVLGNNDNDSGNYAMQSEAFLNSVGTYLSGFIDDNNKVKFMASFSKGGYFSTPLSESVSLIGLNTNPISSTKPNESAAAEQLMWFKGELMNAKSNNKKIIIIQHIPYGLDWYYSADEGKVSSVLDANLQAGYLKLLKQYASIITTIYVGHNHREFFSSPNAAIPLIGTIAFNS
ncbi:MAG TPA: metallophosphoesterase, partial [Aquella sp.]|nr:metallophosphoesterase [Aquella sp.]